MRCGPRCGSAALHVRRLRARDAVVVSGERVVRRERHGGDRSALRAARIARRHRHRSAWRPFEHREARRGEQTRANKMRCWSASDSSVVPVVLDIQTADARHVSSIADRAQRRRDARVIDSRSCSDAATPRAAFPAAGKAARNEQDLARAAAARCAPPALHSPAVARNSAMRAASFGPVTSTRVPARSTA